MISLGTEISDVWRYLSRAMMREYKFSYEFFYGLLDESRAVFSFYL